MPIFTHLKIELDSTADSFSRFYQETTKTPETYAKFVAGVIGEFTRAFNTDSFFSDYHHSRLIPIFNETTSEMIAFKLIDAVSHEELLISKENLNSTAQNKLKDFLGTGKSLEEIENYFKALYRTDQKLKIGLMAFCGELRRKYIDSFIGAKPERAKTTLAYLSVQAFPAELKFIVGQTDNELLVRQADSASNRFFSLQRNEDGSYRLIESVCFDVVALSNNRKLASIYVRSTYDITSGGNLTKFPPLLLSIEETADLQETERAQLNNFFEKQVFSVANNPVLEKKELIIRHISTATRQELLQQLSCEEAAKLNFLGHEFIARTVGAAPLQSQTLHFSGLQKPSKILKWMASHKLALSICLFILLAAITVAVLSGAFNIIPALPFLTAVTIKGVSLSAATLSAALESLLGFVLFCSGLLISSAIPQRSSTVLSAAQKKDPLAILASSPARSSARLEPSSSGHRLTSSAYAVPSAESEGAGATPIPNRGPATCGTD